MILIDIEQTCLFELLKGALFGLRPVIPDGVNWHKLYEYSKIQCVVPLISSCIPDENREEWNSISRFYKAHFMQMIYTQNLIVNLLNDNNIPFVILKGTAAAIYYPQPLLRTFGDIDLYISEKHLDTVLDLFKCNRYVYVSNNERHYEFEKNGIDVELHYRFSCEYYKNIDHIVLKGLDNSVKYKIGDSVFSGLPKYENGLVLLGHIMQHIKDTGIGLRQIIDWMMFVHKELDDTAWESNFRELAIEAGLEKLAITVTFMCKKWMGLPKEITWCNYADEEVADQLLLRILNDGNFGQERSSFENVRKSMNEMGTFRYLQKAGMVNWNLAQKHAVLRPFAWFYQLCRFVKSGISEVISGNKVFRKTDNNMNLEDLFERLK